MEKNQSKVVCLLFVSAKRIDMKCHQRMTVQSFTIQQKNRREEKSQPIGNVDISYDDSDTLNSHRSGGHWVVSWVEWERKSENINFSVRVDRLTT
jgi:hypothetical protein